MTERDPGLEGPPPEGAERPEAAPSAEKEAEQKGKLVEGSPDPRGQSRGLFQHLSEIRSRLSSLYQRGGQPQEAPRAQPEGTEARQESAPANEWKPPRPLTRKEKEEGLEPSSDLKERELFLSWRGRLSQEEQEELNRVRHALSLGSTYRDRKAENMAISKHRFGEDYEPKKDRKIAQQRAETKEQLIKNYARRETLKYRKETLEGEGKKLADEDEKELADLDKKLETSEAILLTDEEKRAVQEIAGGNREGARAILRARAESGRVPVHVEDFKENQLWELNIGVIAIRGIEDRFVNVQRFDPQKGPDGPVIRIPLVQLAQEGTYLSQWTGRALTPEERSIYYKESEKGRYKDPPKRV
jgi:hypothetical protein